MAMVEDFINDGNYKIKNSDSDINPFDMIENKENARDHEDLEEALDAPDLEDEDMILLDDELYVSKDEDE